MVFLLTVAVGYWCRADDKQDNAEADQGVSVEEVVQRLSQVEAKLHGFRVRCDSTSKFRTQGIDGQQLRLPGAVAGPGGARTDIAGVWHYRDDGSWCFDGDMSSAATSETTPPSHLRQLLFSVFDGPRGRGKYILLDTPDSDIRNAKEKEVFASSPGRMRFQTQPLEFLTLNDGISIRDELLQKDAKVTGRDLLNGRSVVILATKVWETRFNPQLYREFWFDWERSVVVRRQTFTRLSQDRPWRLLHRRDCQGFKRDSVTQLWLPQSAKEFNWTVDEQGQIVLARMEAFVFNDWQINPDFDRALFSIDRGLRPGLTDSLSSGE